MGAGFTKPLGPVILENRWDAGIAAGTDGVAGATSIRVIAINPE